MEIRVFADAASVAEAAAGLIAQAAREAVAQRGTFTLAVSGGSTPWVMLRELSAQQLPWASIHIFQVDERIAPQGDKDRNLTHLQESLASASLPPANIHAMPVEAQDLEEAARGYALTLQMAAGVPPTLDLVHLGLGPDGHTASLVPGDAVLDVAGSDVALTGVYQGRRRMTLTYPAIDRARRILWLVTGAEKSSMLPRLMACDRSIPAGRVRSDQALVLADAAAASGLESVKRAGE